MKTVRQEWRRCPYWWGTGDLILIESSAGQLVLCEIITYEDGRESVNPILKSQLPQIP